MAKVATRKRGKKWYYSIEATEYTPDGKRRRIEKGGFLTKKEAEEAGTKAQADLARGNIALLSDKISVKDYLNEWLDKKEKEVRPNTIANYRSCLKPTFDFFGDKTLQKLRPRDVEAYVQDLAAKGHARGTIGRELRVLREALSYAVFPMELLTVNPAQYIKIPKNAPAKVIERTVIRDKKLNELLSAYPFGHPLHMPIVIASHTGMRMSEVLGLTWDCVEFEKRTVTVVRQLIHTSNVGNYFGPPKTASSERTILIDADFLNTLKKWKRQQSENELECGGAYLRIYEGDDGAVWQISKSETPGTGFIRRDLVCTDEHGKRISRDAFRTGLKRYGLNTHSLRHTHATLCIEFPLCCVKTPAQNYRAGVVLYFKSSNVYPIRP
ncbi:MAG: site-specific integrase [Selenomonadaceae bacterium]|nr:site-specific integrase [Selenomonadaceae bacterium]